MAIEVDDNNETILENTTIAMNTDIDREDDDVNHSTDDDCDDEGYLDLFANYTMDWSGGL